MDHSRHLSSLFSSFQQALTINVQYEILPMTGLKLRAADIGSNHSANGATTTAHHEMTFNVYS